MTDIRGDGERPRLLDPLGIPDYRRLLIGNGLWWQAMWMELLVVGWLVLELTDSPWLVALVTFYRAVPLLIWGFVSGAVIDRMGQRGIILICQSITLAAYTCVGLLIWSGQVAYWQLCLLSFVLGSAWAFDWPARRSYMPDLVGKTRTVDAMMLEAFVQMVSRILGPFSAGLLLDTFGASGCYAVLGGAFIIIDSVQRGVLVLLLNWMNFQQELRTDEGRGAKVFVEFRSNNSRKATRISWRR